MEDVYSSVPTVLEAVLNVASQQLDGILLYLILMATIAVITLVAHLWHKNVTVTMSMLALIVASNGFAAFKVGAVSPDNEPKSYRSFLPLNGQIKVGHLLISLSDVDTLKMPKGEKCDAEKMEAPYPWEFNRTFGAETVARFLELGRERLRRNFVVTEEIISTWPDNEKLISITDIDSWCKFTGILEEMEVKNRTTEREINLRSAFSKWPLARLEVRDGMDDNLISQRYMPEGDTLQVKDGMGRNITIKVEAIFNGDRDLGESEACVLRVFREGK